MKESSSIIIFKPTQFIITPKMNNMDIDKFLSFMENIKRLYSNDTGLYGIIWDFDRETNSIIISNRSTVSGEDIVGQFCLISKWLFYNEYRISGIFEFCIGEYIENIFVDGYTSIITHKIYPNKILNRDLYKKKNEINNKISTNFHNYININLNKTHKNNDKSISKTSIIDRIFYWGKVLVFSSIIIGAAVIKCITCNP